MSCHHRATATALASGNKYAGYARGYTDTAVVDVFCVFDELFKEVLIYLVFLT